MEYGDSHATERRRYSRVQAQDRALTARTGDILGFPYHLVDISEGGMAFRYVGEGPISLADSRMDIYLDDHLCVGALPVTVASDKHLDGEILLRRRCGVFFGDLEEGQRCQLEGFIRNSESPPPSRWRPSPVGSRRA